MEEGQSETRQEAGSGAQTTGATTENNNSNGNTAAEVERRQETESRGGGLPRGVREELRRLRSERREYRDQIEALKADLETIKGSGRSSVSNDEAGASSIWDDPDKYLAAREEKVAEKVSKRVREEMGQTDRERQHRQAVEDAERWLLNQPDLKEDHDAVDDIAEILAGDARLQRITAVDPQFAAEKAFALWRERKGIGGERRREAETSAARSATVRPSATVGGSDGKTWSRKDVESYLNEARGTPDFDKRFSEVTKALKDGRIK